jgi:hypothetical protein
MGLCHDEWDYAMGFSRRDPHAGKTFSVREKDDTEEYLLSLTPARKKAREAVKLFLTTVGKLLDEKGEDPPMNREELHKLFPVFAKRMEFNGLFYRLKRDRCMAVTILLRDDRPEKEKSFWFIVPRHYYNTEPDRVDNHPEKDKLTEVAREVCKLWLPNWNWEPSVSNATK